MTALQTAARSGMDVQLLIPFSSDSWISGSATNSYLETLLESGVKVFTYKKGFIHAKTMVLMMKFQPMEPLIWTVEALRSILR
ncbi:MAG: phospholipase D-like domain-containing protein [Bacteroidota bacterium]